MNESTRRSLGIALLVALVVWGMIVTVAYYAVPVHQAAMISDSGRTLVASICGDWSACGGIVALIASVFSFIGKLGPFALYIILSSLMLLGFAIRSYMRDEEWVIRETLRPVTMIALFVLSAWALLLGLAYSDNGGLPMNRVIEPIAQVYPDVSTEGLADLRANFDELKERGCLVSPMPLVNGAMAYTYSFSCLQSGFFTRVFAQMSMILLLIFNVLVLGRAALYAARLRNFPPMAEGVVSAGLGACILAALLWLISMLAVYTQAVGWAVLVGIPAVLFPHALFWLRAMWNERLEIEVRPWSVRILVAWLLITLLAFNFLNVVRPFPIGWDDLGRYLNQPRLLVSYGHFIPTLSTFSWEYVTSLGFLCFGYDSTFGATLSMLINWSAGLLAVMSVWLFGSAYLGKGRGVLSALLYYSLPMVGHFSFADMKVDNAIFAIGSLAAFCAFVAVCPPTGPDGEDHGGMHESSVLALLALAGVFAGFAFGMKPTATMLVMAIGTVLVGVQLGWAGMLGSSILAFAVFVKQGVFRAAEVSGKVFGDPHFLSQKLLIVLLTVFGAAFVVYSLRSKTSAVRSLVIRLGVFAVAMAVPILPWMTMNNLSYGRFPPKIELSYANHMAPAIIIDGSDPPPGAAIVRSLPNALQVDSKNPACVPTSKAEELDRYWGDYNGPWHYLGLPWRAVMNTDTYGYYVTLFPALLLVPVLLLSPFFWTRAGRWQRLLLGATVFMVLQWCFLANGIVWYGVSMFLGLVVLLEALAVTAPTVVTRWTTGVLLAASLLAGFSHRLWQFDIMQNIFEYPMGKVSAATMEERTIPHYDDIREDIQARGKATPERPYVYRMGTFIPYFIPKGFEVLPLADNQLDMFNCINQEHDAAKTLARLQALGFNSMIFDMNTHTIEKDPNGSLHKKVQAFVDFVNTPGLGIKIVVNDPGAGIAYIQLP